MINKGKEIINKKDIKKMVMNILKINLI